MNNSDSHAAENGGGPKQDVASFRLPLDPEFQPDEIEHVIRISQQAPCMPIFGMTGTGKTVLALLLAQQILERPGTEVHYLSVNEGGIEGEHPPSDLAMTRLADMRGREPKRVKCQSLQPDCVLDDLVGNTPPGSMVILDEVTQIAKGEAQVLGWMNWAVEKGVVLALIAQDPRDLVGPKGTLGADGEDDATKKLGCVFMGKLIRQPDEDSMPKPIQQVLSASRRLQYQPGAPAQFLATTPKPAWTGVVNSSAST